MKANADVVNNAVMQDVGDWICGYIFVVRGRSKILLEEGRGGSGFAGKFR